MRELVISEGLSQADRPPRHVGIRARLAGPLNEGSGQRRARSRNPKGPVLSWLQSPRSSRCSLELRARMTGSLRYDLTAARNAVTKEPIGAEVVERLASRGDFNAADRLESGRQRWTDRVIKRRARRTLRCGREAAGRGCRGFVRSTGTPRRRSRSCLMPTRSTRENRLPRS